jgi:hypothetical protein
MPGKPYMVIVSDRALRRWKKSLRPTAALLASRFCGESLHLRQLGFEIFPENQIHNN